MKFINLKHKCIKYNGLEKCFSPRTIHSRQTALPQSLSFASMETNESKWPINYFEEYKYHIIKKYQTLNIFFLYLPCMLKKNANEQ